MQESGQIAVGTDTLQTPDVRMSEIVTGAVKSLGDWVKQRAQAQLAETTWLVKGVKEGCGSFVRWDSVSFMRDTRSRSELEMLLGKSFTGVFSSDDFSVYNGYPVRAQQKCGAHLRRHFKKVIKLKHGNNPQLGQAFIDLIDAAFEAHRQGRKTQDAIAYHSWAAGFKLEVQTALNQWLPTTGMP